MLKDIVAVYKTNSHPSSRVAGGGATSPEVDPRQFTRTCCHGPPSTIRCCGASPRFSMSLPARLLSKEVTMLDVMTFPFVQPILWGDYYRSDPAVLKYVEQLFSDLVAGPYLNGMAQYGVRPGHVHAPVFVDMHKYPAPSAIWDYELQDQLLAWFKGGVVKSPGVDQVNLL